MRFVCILILVTTIGFAQKKPDSTEQVLFEKAYRLSFDSNTYEQALLKFYEFRVLYPNSGRAHYNIGYLEREIGNTQVAIHVFKQILDEPYDENDPNGLMEPYTLYKHHSCRNLAEIYLEEGNLREAERFINKYEKEFPYQHFCGNEFAAYDMYKAVMRAKLFVGQRNEDKAIQKLLPFIFSNDLASNEELIEELITILSQKYTVENIKKDLEMALNSIRIDIKKDEESASMSLYGEKISMNNYYDIYNTFDSAELSGVEKYKKLAMTNSLFKRFLFP